jgi:saccharopine dehydrogenase-like NADP-dependent oxidoreductase
MWKFGVFVEQEVIMKRVLMLGAGKVGSLIACLLSETGEYQVCVGDSDGNAIQRLKELHYRSAQNLY